MIILCSQQHIALHLLAQPKTRRVTQRLSCLTCKTPSNLLSHLQEYAVLSTVPEVVHTDADLTESLPKLSLAVDEEEARLAGLDNASIARQLDATLEGALGGSFLEATEVLPIRVRLANSGRGDLVQISWRIHLWRLGEYHLCA